MYHDLAGNTHNLRCTRSYPLLAKLVQAVMKNRDNLSSSSEKVPVKIRLQRKNKSFLSSLS